MSRLLGILGGGQLGRMLGLAAAPIGVRCRFLEPAADPSAAAVGEVVAAAYDDPSGLDRLAAGTDVVTVEFENVPIAALERLAGRVALRPGVASLRLSQDRLGEKQGLRALGIPTAPFAAVDDRAGLDAAVAAVGLPAVLKSRRLGYDGKGQRVLRDPDHLGAAWEALGGVPCILESLVTFDRELATLAVRGTDGETAFYPVVETRHHRGLLRSAIAPAPGLDPATADRLIGWHLALLRSLDHVGVLCVEWFDSPSGPVANEIAPRVHNSGHWSIEGSETSQFENHVRAVFGLPLGATEARGHSVMVNLVGSPPPVDEVLRVPGAHLHLYGKAPRLERKVGHVTLVTPSADAGAVALRRLLEVVGG